MSIIIDNHLDKDIDKAYKDIINQIIQAVVNYEDCPYDYEVSVLITSNEEIKALNKEFREIDRETDVLSFPLIDFDIPGDFEMIGDIEEFFDLDTNNILFGDIVISFDKLLEQAKEYGHSIQRELAFLVTHGMLHLLGYDHINEEEKDIMFLRQEEILEKAGFIR
jgi:probable rRNA maturation factor